MNRKKKLYIYVNLKCLKQKHEDLCIVGAGEGKLYKPHHNFYEDSTVTTAFMVAKRKVQVVSPTEHTKNSECYSEVESKTPSCCIYTIFHFRMKVYLVFNL
jgi:hypothetical protein